MPITRRQVLEHLATASDASSGKTTTIESLASSLDAEPQAVVQHVDGLEDCELAICGQGGAVRITVTGEELLDLDTDEGMIVDIPSGEMSR